MAITDLTGTKWQFSDTITQVSQDAKSFIVYFTVYNNAYPKGISGNFIYRYGSSDRNRVDMSYRYPEHQTPPEYTRKCATYIERTSGASCWLDDNLVGNVSAPLVEVTGGADATDPDIIAWFEANATQIVDPPQDWLYKFLNDSGLTRVFQKLKAVLDKKQDTLESGTNIKTVNDQSLLGGGNINIGGDGAVIITYGETPYSEVSAAVTANKVIVVKDARGGMRHDEYETVVETSTSDRHVILVMVDRHIIVDDEESWTIDWIPQRVNGFEQESSVAFDFSDRFYEHTNGCEFIFPSPVAATPNQDSVDLHVTVKDKTSAITIPSKNYVDGKTGDLTSLTTDNKTNLVSAINEVYEKSGEPFRVKNWANSSLNVSIPYCTEEVANTSIAKMTYSIDAEEGASYQIVGMIAYEVFDSSNQRINCWPVCQFTGNGQKELSVRWACMGSSRKTATKINAWVLLKHR